MAWRGDFYSQLVAWMKIILPLVALGLLSTLFLISRTVDPTQQPVVQIDLEQRAHEQGATRPSFAGVTTGGDEVSFMAQRARPDPTDPDRLIADDVKTELQLRAGPLIEITARNADMHQSRYTAALDGNVRMQTSNGYTLKTQKLNTRFDELYAETPGEVHGTGPIGEITAGRMILTGDVEAGDAEMLFTQGIKLVYIPNSSED